MKHPKTGPLTTIKRDASRVFAEVRRSEEPVMITEHGRPAARAPFGRYSTGRSN